jgi:hypothetical protein
MNQGVTEQVVIHERFRGPPDSGNGGYVCGLIGREFDEPASVSLRVPPPLERPLDLHRGEDGKLELRDGDMVVADGGPAELLLEVPEPPSVEEADDAVERFLFWHDHPFPGCFVCGTDRSYPDGLRIFPGQVEGRAIVAAPWIPDIGLAGDGGTLAPELMWAVLDCPTSFGAVLLGVMGTSVLARLTAELHGAVRPGEPHVVIGWPIGRDGRKSEGGSAVFTADGQLLARAKGLWIELKQEG